MASAYPIHLAPRQLIITTPSSLLLHLSPSSSTSITSSRLTSIKYNQTPNDSFENRFLAESADIIRNTLSPLQQRLFNISNERGSSSWLSVLPLKRHGFHLHKGAFCDGLSLRYGWDIPHLPNNCVCGASFTIDHAINCPCGGYPSIRHNDLRDITTSLMKEISRDVAVEPTLQPLSGETLQPQSAIRDDNAHSDIRAEGFWSGQQQAFFDVKVFNPSAASYRKKSLQTTYR